MTLVFPTQRVNFSTSRLVRRLVLLHLVSNSINMSLCICTPAAMTGCDVTIFTSIQLYHYCSIQTVNNPSCTRAENCSVDDWMLASIQSYWLLSDATESIDRLRPSWLNSVAAQAFSASFFLWVHDNFKLSWWTVIEACICSVQHSSHRTLGHAPLDFAVLQSGLVSFTEINMTADYLQTV